MTATQRVNSLGWVHSARPPYRGCDAAPPLCHRESPVYGHALGVAPLERYAVAKCVWVRLE